MSQNDNNDYEEDDDGSGEPAGADTAKGAHEKPMGFFDHLEELRWTLIKCVIVYGVFTAILAVFLKRFHHLLLWPLDIARASYPQLTLDLGTTGVTESFSVVFNLCALGALLPSVPFFFLFAAQFIAPALTSKEKHMVTPVCVASFVLFLAGSALSFFVMAPAMLKFSAEFNDMLGFVTRWTPGSYYGTITWLTIGAGLSFQAPIVILLLVHLGFLRTKTLCRYRRHAIVVIVIVVALIAPTPDVLMMAIFAAPLYLLFELSIILGRRVEKKRALRECLEDDEEDDEEEEGEEE
jgi:sec-independent protein translocase protein TatC